MISNPVRREDVQSRAVRFDNFRELALSQRLSPLGLIFRSPTLTSGKIILINFRIS